MAPPESEQAEKQAREAVAEEPVWPVWAVVLEQVELEQVELELVEEKGKEQEAEAERVQLFG